jgi:peptidoglycan/LPS O-acetylase OafA/YrhL
MPQPASDYRPDIDGLRAIAVLSVLFFHIGYPWMPGGFVGVDVFFVISGFLITKIIVDDLARERFSFAGFFERRARRLLPTMFAVVALCAVAAFLLMTPEHLQAFARSAISAIFAYSNILFWSQADYFDLSARLKPLLHTWSLSVEWQFYAVWPLFIWIISKFRSRALLIGSIAAAGLLSFAANLALQNGWLPGLGDIKTTLFFQTPFRIFEFAAGALLIFARPITRPRVAVPALLIGLAAILWSVLTLDELVIFPSYNALPAVAGTVLAIWAGRAPVAGAILSNPLSAFVGRISYSLYLVHWPLIVFTEYFNIELANEIQGRVLVGTSLVAATALHFIVERPFHVGGWLRQGGGPALAAMSAAAIVVPCWLALQDGLIWRLDPNAARIQADNTTTGVSQEAMGHLGCTSWCPFAATDPPAPTATNILVIGDSHVDHYTKALKELGGDRHVFWLAWGPSCFFGLTMHTIYADGTINKAPCDASHQELDAWYPAFKFQAVIVGQLWSGYLKDGLQKDGAGVTFPDNLTAYRSMLADIAARFDGYKGKIVFVGRAPNTNLACYLRPRYFAMPCPKQPLDEFKEFRQAFEEWSATAKLDVALVNPVDTICPGYGECRVADDRNHVLYTDAHHLSVYGARPIVAQILSIIDNAPAIADAR